MLIGKFTHFLQDRYHFRHTSVIDRTEYDFEILKIAMDEPTEFGSQGTLLCWYGGEKNYDWEKYMRESDNDDCGFSRYFFGFQVYLQFYTSPSRTAGINRFTLLTPRNDWTGWEGLIVEEFEYAESNFSDEAPYFEELMEQNLSTKYNVQKIADEMVSKYISD